MDIIMHIAGIRIELMGWLEEKDRWALYTACKNDRTRSNPTFYRICHCCWVRPQAPRNTNDAWCVICGAPTCNFCNRGFTFKPIEGRRYGTFMQSLCHKCMEKMKAADVRPVRQPAIKRLKFEQ